jgi:hypothetical protein
MRVHHIAILLALGLTSLSVACSNSNPSADLQKEVKTIVSWIETTRAVGEAWKNGSVPSAYAALTFQTAQENLKQEIDSIQSIPISGSAKADLSMKLQQMEISLGEAVQAIEKSDTSALEQTLNQLTTAQQALSASTK